ncbi:MAG: hypothetical protein QS748_05755 [Candidatus Endonucleobacter bathymodioli]|uniref:Uncharacterized protein n=1 Tax=Candidatus Endonucleibacter bathymodioli TaxID=539814 RepID=A0AA90NLA0_9GAMM|nr:hypothetical protein [Candidatus Endonucleobacter bathymodioli]
MKLGGESGSHKSSVIKPFKFIDKDHTLSSSGTYINKKVRKAENMIYNKLPFRLDKKHMHKHQDVAQTSLYDRRAEALGAISINKLVTDIDNEVCVDDFVSKDIGLSSGMSDEVEKIAVLVNEAGVGGVINEFGNITPNDNGMNKDNSLVVVNKEKFKEHNQQDITLLFDNIIKGVKNPRSLVAIKKEISKACGNSVITETQQKHLSKSMSSKLNKMLKYRDESIARVKTKSDDNGLLPYEVNIEGLKHIHSLAFAAKEIDPKLFSKFGTSLLELSERTYIDSTSKLSPAGKDLSEIDKMFNGSKENYSSYVEPLLEMAQDNKNVKRDMKYQTIYECNNKTLESELKIIPTLTNKLDEFEELESKYRVRLSTVVDKVQDLEFRISSMQLAFDNLKKVQSKSKTVRRVDFNYQKKRSANMNELKKMRKQAKGIRNQGLTIRKSMDSLHEKHHDVTCLLLHKRAKYSNSLSHIKDPACILDKNRGCNEIVDQKLKDIFNKREQRIGSTDNTDFALAKKFFHDKKAHRSYSDSQLEDMVKVFESLMGNTSQNYSCEGSLLLLEQATSNGVGYNSGMFAKVVNNNIARFGTLSLPLIYRAEEISSSTPEVFILPSKYHDEPLYGEIGNHSLQEDKYSIRESERELKKEEATTFKQNVLLGKAQNGTHASLTPSHVDVAAPTITSETELELTFTMPPTIVPNAPPLPPLTPMATAAPTQEININNSNDDRLTTDTLVKVREGLKSVNIDNQRTKNEVSVNSMIEGISARIPQRHDSINGDSFEEELINTVKHLKKENLLNKDDAVNKILDIITKQNQDIDAESLKTSAEEIWAHSALTEQDIRNIIAKAEEWD